MTVSRSPCTICQHLRPGLRCAAFPAGIPVAVQYETFHARVLPGQAGADVFTPRADAPPFDLRAHLSATQAADAMLPGGPDG